jgi:hypothetical protein
LLKRSALRPVDKALFLGTSAYIDVVRPTADVNGPAADGLGYAASVPRAAGSGSRGMSTSPPR